MAHSVLIAGGGPVGVALALELARRGVASTVIERHREPQPIPKGQNLTQRTMEHFRAWGVEEAIRKASPIPVEFGIGGLTAYGTLLSDWHYDWYQRALVRPFYACDNTRLPQYATERILRERASECAPITMLSGWTVRAMEQSPDRVRVNVQSSNGETRDLEGDWLVGCDGSRSIVREEAGITQTRDDHDTRMVLLVFRSQSLNTLLARYKGKSFFNVLHPELDGYWRFFGRVDTGETWFFHSPVSASTTRDNFDFHAYLERVVGARFDCTIEHIGFWDLRFEVANRYRSGRVFVAGDAAHSHPPYGGYGINTGFEDARNLGWKLAAASEGWAGPTLLDSYHDERHPVFVSTARDFIRNYIDEDGAFLRANDPSRDRADFESAWAKRASGTSAEIHSFEPHYEGSPIVWGPEGALSSASGQHQFKARAGHHLAPQPRSGGGHVFDAPSPGFTLLCLGDAACGSEERDGWVASLQAAARQRNVPLAVLSEPASAPRDAYGAPLVLVRPDGFVAWAGDSEMNPRLLIERASGWT